MRYRVAWAWLETGRFVRDVTIEVRETRIAGIRSGASADVDLGNRVLIPGLINAHTHLEFSHLHQPCQPLDDFPAWISAVIRTRRERVSASTALRSGLKESLGQGCIALADIVTTDWPSWQAAADTLPIAPRSILFREVLGLAPQAVPDTLEALREFLQQAQTAPALAETAISPHAPYSVHEDLFRGACELATEFAAPLAMHLAESPAELQLLKNRTGPLVDLFTQMGIWQEDSIQRRRPCDYVRVLADLPRSLIIHGNFLEDESVRLLARHPRMSLVYCPRTHASMQASSHPWKTMLAAGVRVCLGTDSRATNPNLSLWEELQFLKSRHPELRCGELLPLATSEAAAALGWEQECGMLKEGHSADWCVVALPDPSTDPEAGLLNGTIQSVMLRGQWIRNDFAES